MLFSSESKIVEGLRSTSLFSIAFIQDKMDAVGSYFALRSENNQLRKENTRLAYENYQLQDALLENIRLRKLLQLKYEVAFDFIPAKVVGFSPHDIATGLMLSTGDYEKVHKNAAVITDDGLVGKIVKRSGEFAICQMLIMPGSRVSVRIQRNRELGVVAWDGGNALVLDYVPNTIDVKPGDVLFTSGLSRIFPPNLKVGVVTAAEKRIQQLFQEIKVKPAVNFNRLEEVFILEPLQNNE